jgi:hypothetical protein
MAHDPHREQDREQQKEQQLAPFLLLSDEGDDGEEIIIPVDGNVSPISPSSSSIPEGASSNDHDRKNLTPMMKKQQQEKKKDRKDRVVSFRMSEREYACRLSMAKLCYENGLTKGPDIVSFIRLAMECLWQYINSQAQGEPSAEEKEENRQQPQKKQEGAVERQQDVNYHGMTASSSRATAVTATTNTAAMGQHTRESMARASPKHMRARW